MPTLNFIGKNDVISHHLTVPYHELVVNEKKSFNNKDKENNLIIHGDSLVALKSLIPHYANKIQCVYLDFPYNTGKEGWVYNDNVNSPTHKKWLAKTVDREDQARHDKWLCMVYPRLSIIKELMTDSGIIILSIDDNEVSNLKLILDEIFGDENCIGILPTIMNLKGNQSDQGFAGTHEYTLVYAKTYDSNKKKPNVNIIQFKVDEDGLNEWKEDEKGLYKEGGNLKSAKTEYVENSPSFFPVFITNDDRVYVTENNKPKNKDDTGIWPYNDNKKSRWYWNKEKFSKEDDEIIIKRTVNGISLYKKQRPELGEAPSKKPKTIFYKAQYSSGNGTNQLKAIFGEKVFNYPKPLDLIKDLLSITTTSDSIVLDATAGSGVTGHAILDLNHEDNGNRKFIMIECEDYADKITAERVRRIIKGVPNTKFSEGREGGFSYLEIGTAISVEAMLSKDTMPSWEALAQHVYWLATGKPIEKTPKENKDYYVGSYKNRHVYLLYKASKKFMESEDAILKASQVEKISANYQHSKEIIIYATNAYISVQDMKKHDTILAMIPSTIDQ